MENIGFYEKFKDLSQKELNEEFIAACTFSYFDKVKYLLTSPDIEKHAEIHAKNDEGFRNACYYKHLEIVEYIIFNMNIERTKDIVKFLIKNPDEQFLNMFKLKDLNEKLNKELNKELEFRKRKEKKIKI